MAPRTRLIIGGVIFGLVALFLLARGCSGRGAGTATSPAPAPSATEKTEPAPAKKVKPEPRSTVDITTVTRDGDTAADIDTARDATEKLLKKGAKKVTVTVRRGRAVAEYLTAEDAHELAKKQAELEAAEQEKTQLERRIAVVNKQKFQAECLRDSYKSDLITNPNQPAAAILHTDQLQKEKITLVNEKIVELSGLRDKLKRVSAKIKKLSPDSR